MDKAQIFLLPFAGGNCYSYNFLRKNILNLGMEFHNLELPGRGKRNKEPLPDNYRNAVQDYCKQIKNARNTIPYILYGHSMGADLAFWVCKEMESLNDPPSHLVVTAHSSPLFKSWFRSIFMGKIHKLNDRKLKKTLRSMEAVPERILRDDKLFKAINPVVRADFKLVESDFKAREKTVINTPVYAIMGSREKGVANINNWQNYTHGQMTSRILEGGHFFIHNHVDELIKIFDSCLEKKNHLKKF